MKRVVIGVVVCLALALQAAAFAQGRPDFSGTWRFNQAKSSQDIAGNTPIVPFPSQLVVKQTATELHVDGTSVRQQPTSAVFKLDGSKVSIKAPSGITETGEAKVEGSNLVITSRRSFTSPLGETVVDFKEVWTLTGSVLTIEKTRTESGDSATVKAVFDKMS
jgi:hypothetical protein